MFAPRFHGRRSVRRLNYDYAGCGCYFVTVCAARRGSRLGHIENETFHSNAHGRILIRHWLETPGLRGDVTLDEWVLMPDHFHALIWLNGEAVTSTPTFGHRVPGSLGAIIGGWKSACTKEFNWHRQTHGWPVCKLWQRNYYDHIVRDERELNLIRQYIQTNPARWKTDEHW